MVDELHQSLPVEQAEQYEKYLAALFAVLLEDKFKDGLDHEAIIAFVDELRERFRDSEPRFKAFVVEGVIRASAGETHIFDDLPQEEIIPSRVQVIGTLAMDGTSVRSDLSKLLTVADELMNDLGLVGGEPIIRR